jgi:lysophospholipase L1-like esterase
MQRRKFFQSAMFLPFLGHSVATKSDDVTSSETVVVNAGIGGNNTVDLLRRIEKDCLSHQPDLTILTVGTNDMNSRKHIDLPVFGENLTRIISLLKVAKSNVLLTTLLPVYEPYLMERHPRTFYEPEGHYARKKQYNNLIRKIAEDQKLPLIDMHHIFEATGEIGEGKESLLQNEVNSQKKDGVHPTPDGYRTMAIAIYQLLEQSGLSYSRIVCFGDSITAGDGGVLGKSYPAYLKKLLK